MTEGAKKVEEGKYRIGAVAKMTGISAHALRAWERRYDGLMPQRGRTGGRLYTDADLARLRLIRQLLDRGHAIGELVTLNADQLQSRLGTHGQFVRGDGRAPAPAQVASEFVDAVARLDVHGADRVLSQTAVSFDPRQLVLEIVVPAIERLCVKHDQGELRTVHANLAASVLQGFLHSMNRLYVRPNQTWSVFCATPVREPHEFGSLLAAYLATMHGARAIYLGSQLQVADMLEVTEKTGCDTLILSVLSESNPKLPADLIELSSRARGCELILAGRGAARYAAYAPGCRVSPDATSLQKFFETHDAPDPAARARLAEVKCSL